MPVVPVPDPQAYVMMAEARLGPWAWLLPVLSLLLLLFPATTLAQEPQVCELVGVIPEVMENYLPKEAIANISLPAGQVLVLDEFPQKDMFRVEGHQLFLTKAPDYEVTQTLMAYLLCKKDQHTVSRLNVLVYVLNENDNSPVFHEPQLTVNVSEDTKVGTVVVSEDRLQAEDKDGDTLFYELWGLNPDANNYFALLAVNNPAIKLNQTLDYERNNSMTFHLIARDTRDPDEPGSHNATATVTVSIQQADLRPPWFLPCAFTDGKICVNTGYRGSIPIDEIKTEAVSLYPGPLYAIDGDRAINEDVQYRILYGNTDDTFNVDPKTGNITMTKAVRTNTTFTLGVLAEQVINKQRWSTTQVTLQVAVGNDNPPVFLEKLYRGILPSGSGPNVPVRDLADPRSILIIRATDDDFQNGYNPAIRYRVLGNDPFVVLQGMVLTSAELGEARTFSMKVEALDEMTFDKAETDLEVTVTAAPGGTTVVPTSATSVTTPTPDPRPPSPTLATSGTPTPTPETSGATITTLPPTTILPTLSRSTTTTTMASMATLLPTLPGSTTTTTMASMATLLPTLSGSTTTTTMTSTATFMPTLPGSTTSTTTTTTQTGPNPMTPQTSGPPKTPPSHSPLPTTKTSPGARTVPPVPGGATSTAPPPVGSPGSTTGSPEPSASAVTSGQTNRPLDSTEREPALIKKSKYTQDMAILGGVLGALLLLCLVALGFLLYKEYGYRFRTYFLNNSVDKEPKGLHINPSFLDEEYPTWKTPPTPQLEKKAMPVALNETPCEKAKSGPPSLQPPEGDVPPAPSREEDAESDKEVKSILTKERKPEQNGYKAVWFGEDIGAEVDVVVINDRVGDEEEEEEEEGGEGEKQQEEEEEKTASIQFVSFRPARDQPGTESNVSHI
ncbi:cadherin-related family member 5 [Tachyglossus aculeatus]|uniref:cadherin-related family member 5 n=1 Tax=Tachyglossus aculeatus TaxID=9261 RepID=UPI0018F52572|nr:cadherin-related family member 5 [Tachyglossus aculeatus]XP_038620478.1 cadherin-related family member 5 [Tachyglossus aculeatus]